MIALDTNVLLRYVVDDGSAEARLAREHLPPLAREASAFFVSLVVLSEAAWVLRSSFKYRRKEITSFIGHLLDDAVFRVEAGEAARNALTAFRSGRHDYSDALVIEIAKTAGCSRVLTFDRAMRGLAEVEVLMSGT